MSLSVGDRLGPYEILALIGAGGMGEVYRARDTQLKRDVALKILPDALAQDADRMARFQREAEVLASLNHPNIATIYGVEERALVMEFVDGESLHGPLSVDEASKIALQIAEALEYAHEKGVIHRDLKPANIKITPAGSVKLLDFGLAKAFTTDREMPAHSANSPTLTIGATEVGVILGTAAYMSPEQASGKTVDKRSDIWSYGVVAWEILTGKQLFNGETISHTLADVLRAPIDFGKLPEKTPAPIRTLLERCLDRNARNRLRDIGEARIAIQAYLANPRAGADTDRAPRSISRSARGSRLVAWILVGLLFVIAAVFFALWFVRPPAPRLVSHFTIDAPQDTSFANQYLATAVSPNGRYVVFGANSNLSNPLLWLRELDSLEMRPLPGTEGANMPFWSPDSKSIAFLAEYKIKRLDLQGGAPLTLCDTPGIRGAGVGGTWNRDGVILVGGTKGLYRIPASGGQPLLVTKADPTHKETEHGYPQFLPDGKRFLFFVQSGDPGIEGIYAASLDHPETRVQILKTNAKAIYVQSIVAGPGHLLWVRERTLFAQGFAPGKLRLLGEPEAVTQDISINAIRRAAFWASETGVLVYRTGGATSYRMAWFNRDGKAAGQLETAANAGGSLRLSPDSNRLAFSRNGGGTSVNMWLLEFSRSVFTRLTFSASSDWGPAWSPDGRQIAFSSDRTGVLQIYRKDAGGGGQEEQLTSGPNDKRVTDWSRDGKYLLYSQDDATGSPDLWALALEGDRKPIPLLRTRFAEVKGQFSPDGKWIAYESNESGGFEIYIRRFPSSGGQWQISNRGGTDPKWRGDGKELFYLSPNRRMMAVTIRASPASIQADTPRELFPAPVSSAPLGTAPYDVTADGQRFLLGQAVEGGSRVQPLTVVVNWEAGLKK